MAKRLEREGLQGGDAISRWLHTGVTAIQQVAGHRDLRKCRHEDISAQLRNIMDNIIFVVDIN